MLIVRGSVTDVEAALVNGRLPCPVCQGVLGPWGWAAQRSVRRFGEVWRGRPRRGRCRSCLVTHVLLAPWMLMRRRDAVEVIGWSLFGWAGGRGYRRVAEVVGVPWTTVRGWCRRFRERAEEIRMLFTRVAFRLDPVLVELEPRPTSVLDALEAIGAAVRAGDDRFGDSGRPWEFVSRVTSGRLLCNMSSLFAEWV